MAGNGFKGLKGSKNYRKRSEMPRNNFKFLKWMETDDNGWEWLDWMEVDKLQ